MDVFQVFFLVIPLVICLILVIWLWKMRRRNLHVIEELTSNIQTQRAELRERESQLADIRSDVKAKETSRRELVHNLASRVSLVNGSLEDLIDDEDLDLPEVLKGPIETASLNSRRLFAEIRQLIDSNAQERGEFTLKTEKVYADKFFKQVIDEISHQFGQKGLDVSYSHSLKKGLIVEIDTFRVEKLFLRLLSEGMDEFEGCRVNIHAQTSEDSHHIQFNLEYQFDGQVQHLNSYDQAGSFPQSKFEMRFLSLVWEEHKAIGCHTMSIRFESAVGNIDALGVGTDSHGKSDPLLHIANVLVVEDFAQMRKFITKLLGKKYKVLEAHNGLEALEILETRKIDLVISDLMMPGMNGIKLLEVMKAHDDWNAIPFIMLTAKDDDTSKLTALKNGLDDYVIKPFQSAELLARVHNILNRRIQLGDSTEPPKELSFNEEFMLAISVIVDERLADSDFGVDALVDQSNLSKRSLYRRLKDETGFTPSQYIKERRLLKARECFRNRKFSTVAEVGHAVGYNSSRLFSEQFYQRFGKKPSDFMMKVSG